MNLKNFKLPKINFSSEGLKEISKKIFQDRYEKVLLDLIELEEENPNDMRVKHKIAEIYYKKEMIEEAVNKYREIAQYFEKEEFILKAIKACNSLLKIKPDLVQFNLKLAALYLKLGMINEAAGQYRIAINYYATHGDPAKTLGLSQDLVKIDPSNDNRAKLAEIYQNAGMGKEALKQYEIIAKDYRIKKDYAKLLYFSELILPHQPENKAVLKDVCILHLRNQRPERALKILDHYKMTDAPDFAELVTKAKLMMEALRKNRK